MMTKKPLSKALRYFYGVSDLGFSLMTSVELVFFVFFLTNVAKFPLPMVALIGSITSIGDAVLSPFYGAIISGIKPLKWGRNRSWLLIAPPLVVIFYMFQYTKIGSEAMAAFIVCAGFILSHIVWNIQWVANMTLIPVLATTPEERGLLASRRAFYTGLAGVFFSYIGIAIIRFFNGGTNTEPFGYTMLAGLMAVCMMIGSLIVYKMTDGYEPTGAQAAAGAPGSQNVSVRDMLKQLVLNPYLIVLLIADFFRFMGGFIAASATAYYFNYVAGMALLPVMLLVSALVRTVGSYISAYVMNKISTRTTAILGLLVGGTGMIIVSFFALNVTAVFVGLGITGIFVSMAGAAIIALYADVSVYGEWKTGKNASPFVMGLMNLSLKTAIISRGIVIPVVLAAAGFVAGIDPSAATLELKRAVISVYILIPGIFNFLCCAILFAAYKLTREKLNKYQAELDARHAEIAQ